MYESCSATGYGAADEPSRFGLADGRRKQRLEPRSSMQDRKEWTKEGLGFPLSARCSDRQMVRRCVTSLSAQPDSMRPAIRARKFSQQIWCMDRALIDHEDRMPGCGIAHRCHTQGHQQTCNRAKQVSHPSRVGQDHIIRKRGTSSLAQKFVRNQTCSPPAGHAANGSSDTRAGSTLNAYFPAQTSTLAGRFVRASMS